MLTRLDGDQIFLENICFKDVATFHVSRKLNRHIMRIRDSENPDQKRELERSRPRGNVWCGVMCNQFIGPFFTE